MSGNTKKLATQVGVLESVVFSFLPHATLKTDCLELGFAVGIAPCLPRCLVHLHLSLKSQVHVLFAPLLVPITASGLQG